MVIQTQGLLFDMDGVLISSVGSARRCWRAWCRLYSVPDADNFELPHGVRASDVIAMLRPDVDQAEALRAIEDIELDDVAGIQVLPGVRELLSSLPPERWAIVTSATRRLLEGRLREAGLPEPPHIVTAEEVVRGKPDPEPYRRGAQLLGYAAGDCIVVEDAPSGVAAGVAAGCRVIAVLGSATPEQLSAANWIVPSLAGMTVAMTDQGLQIER